MLIHCGIYRNDFLIEPALAAMLAGELKINDDIESPEDRKTFAFDLFNGPLGVLNSCFIASQMIREGRDRAALLVASEIENNAEVVGKPLLGVKETGSALILARSVNQTCGFGAFIFRDFTQHLQALDTYGTWDQGRPYLSFRKDQRLNEYYLQCVPPVINELLSVENVNPSGISVVFPPQISSGFVSALRDRLNLEEAHFVDLAGDGKDYSTSSLALGFRHACDDGLGKPGDIGLMIGVGPGVQVGAALYYF